MNKIVKYTAFVFLLLSCFLLAGCTAAQPIPDFSQLAKEANRFVISSKSGMNFENRELDSETEKAQIESLLASLENAVRICTINDDYRPEEGNWGWAVSCFHEDQRVFHVQMIGHSRGWHICYQDDPQEIYYDFPLHGKYVDLYSIPDELAELLNLYRILPGPANENQRLHDLLESY